jgi:hypothetical protein
VIGDGAGRHPGIGGGVEHLADPARAIEHGVLAVRM